ncbi:MAG: bacteriocin [Flexistipes sinusarabici]|uniref:Bacteriocin n=1 Tax=Flexistipes sinusarabici TaxID=2352 RepID=A0A5D0MNX4_FLESI|nr:family 1 encapsulin nanocompartment shell protein [Flexistipes sinusarabici]TYB33180.1 MAG: bacteriocin [Flexistipes sinusarabici]
MNILRQNLAPIPDKAWEEINLQANRTLSSHLSVRKFVDVEGPLGTDAASVNTGRLEIVTDKGSAVEYGIPQMQPLVEARVPFKLNLWELDSVLRGAEDIDLSSLEDAAKKIAVFEDKSVYYGLEKANIKGLKDSSEHDALKLPAKTDDLPYITAEAVAKLKSASVDGPYSLVVSVDQMKNIVGLNKGYPLKKQIEDIIGGSVKVSSNISEAYLVSERGGDFRLTLGQDLSIGYLQHDSKEVTLYFTESFTFRILDPAAFIVIK